MDSVRFGRALGVGAREAAKALLHAADAATSEKPAAISRPASTARAASTPPTVHKVNRAEQVVQTTRGVREGSRRFSEAVWKPAAKATGILWLEVTGVFFGLFVLVGGGYCWSHRTVLHTGTLYDQRGFWMMAGMTILFGYFCLSSFVRANLRSRR